MPPKISITASSWASLILPARPRLDPHLLPFRQFSTRTSCRAADTYAGQQQAAHKLARLSRDGEGAGAHAAARAEKARRKAEAANRPPPSPIHGEPTQFVLDFDRPAPAEVDLLTGESLSTAQDPLAGKLNFRLEPFQVASQLQKSKDLTLPVLPAQPEVLLELNDAERDKIWANYQSQVDGLSQKHDTNHEQAMLAINRILKLDVGSSKDRMRVNFDKCIAEFGRHNTDLALLSKNGTQQKVKPRAGKDVGSSEVQIAIMTVKIRNMAKEINENGNHDYHNKRNLRLLVHKRAKMLKYLRRKERGGPRWQHLIKTLGLTEATWNGEIQF